jgi:GTPase SAR1 family protein
LALPTATQSSAGALQPFSDALELDCFQENIIKIILLGDSAVGKSKLVERFLMNEYQPRQASRFPPCPVPAVGSRRPRVLCEPP